MAKQQRELKIRLPEKLLHELKLHCEAEDVTVSDEVRRCIRLMLRRAGRAAPVVEVKTETEAESGELEELRAQVAELQAERFVNGVEIVSRETAREQSMTYYFTGKPCRNGHMAQRLTCNAACTECERERRERQ